VPSPIGHALAGAAIAWSFRGGVSQPELPAGTLTSWKLPVACAVFAALPDVDLLYMPTHRTATHSVPVAILFTIVAAGVTGWVTPIREWCRTAFGGSPAGFIGLACGLAWSSHILLDWLGADANPPYGVQAFWPFSDSWFFSGLNVFPGTERRDPLSMRALVINLRAAVWETVLMGTVAAAAWWLSRRNRSTAREMQPRSLEDSKKP